jgi:branched-chain amino acid transport system ATP-binding protein
VLEIHAVETGYGKVKILRGINLSVRAGGIVALLGGNGTGKSTLLKAISGLLPTWSGSIEFEGESINGLAPNQIVQRGLVQVTQGKDSFPAMTVEENLRLGAYSRNDKAGIAEDFDKVYSYFPVLKERRRQLAATLSGGEVQMLVVSRGLMARPKLMMLDEPSAALAPRVVLDIFRNINRISRDDGITILLVEQNVRMALLLAEYGYVIRDGVIHIEGHSQDLNTDDNVRLAYLGGTVANTEAGLAH